MQFLIFILALLGVNSKYLPNGQVQGVQTEATAPASLRVASPSAMPTMSALQREHTEILQNKHAETFLADIAAKRKEAETTYRTERLTLKTKIAAIRDTKKKTVVTNLDTKLAQVNLDRTTNMTTQITTMTNVLAKASVVGGSTNTAINEAVAKAQSAIASAQAAVTTQAGRQYVFNIATDATLGTSVRETIQMFVADISATQKLVDAAKLAVKEAVIMIYSLDTGKG